MNGWLVSDVQSNNVSIIKCQNLGAFTFKMSDDTLSLAVNNYEKIPYRTYSLIFNTFQHRKRTYFVSEKRRPQNIMKYEAL
jgi:hypothetical protein